MKLDGATASTMYYGYLNQLAPDGSVISGAMLPTAGSVSTPSLLVEATKTEPDKNTYLAAGARPARAPTPDYNYGTHFLYQGHESVIAGYITRVNLDADAAHRVTLLADTLADGARRSRTSTARPGIRLRTGCCSRARAGAAAAVLQATLDYPSTVTKLARVFGIARLRRRPDRLGRQHLAGRGPGRRDQHDESEGAPAQQLRLPLRAGEPERPEPRAAGCRPAGDEARDGDPIVFHAGQVDADISLHGRARPAHLRQPSRPSGSRSTTPPADGFAVFDANAGAKGASGDPVQAAGERRIPPGAGVQRVLFHRDRRHQRHTRSTAARRLRRDVQARRRRSERRQRHPAAAVPRRSRAHRASTTSRSLAKDQVAVVEDAGDTRAHRSATRSTRATCSTSRSTTQPGQTSRCASSPRAVMPRRRSTRRYQRTATVPERGRQ